MENGLKVATFRERITELVEGLGKSQSDIAADLGVSKQTLSAWITGQNSPRTPTVTALAAYFGVTVPWLNGFDVSKYETCLPSSDISRDMLSPDEQRLVELYRNAESTAREYAVEMLENHQKKDTEQSVI